MKKIYIFLMAGALVLGAVSCSKDDNNNNTGGGGGGNNPPPVDVWAKSIGTYKGDVTTSQGTTPDLTVTITKLSESKIRITPGPGNTIMSQQDINVFKGDTSLYHQQGTFDGTFYIIANETPPTMVYGSNNPSISFYGKKQ